MNKACILVIDDESSIRRLLKIIIEGAGYNFEEAQNGKEGLLLAANHPPQLVLLDIELPDINGHQLLKELRGWYSGPIIILSALDNEDDIVMALDSGATDYITKPFRTGELLARIRASIARFGQTQSEQLILINNLEINLTARIVKVEGNTIKLTSTEYNLLTLFVKNAGRVLTHHFILKEIWGVGYQEELQYLRVFVAGLRKKIEPSPTKPIYLITESGIGYRFIGSL